MAKPNDLSRSLTAREQDSTLIVVIEMSLSSWLVAAIVPGLDRQPLKKLAADEQALLQVIHRWRNEAAKIGHAITRTVVAYEAGRDGFWLVSELRRRVAAQPLFESGLCQVADGSKGGGGRNGEKAPAT